MIFLNQKMNLTKEELENFSKNTKNEDYTIFPTIPLLSYASEIFPSVGSQDVSEFETGSYTGQTSAKTLKSINVKYCLIGHREKRKHLNETDDKIVKKIEICEKYNIIPILVIGETYEEYQQSNSFKVVEEKITNIFNNLHCSLENIIIAYEPIWSIGLKAPESKFIEKIIIFIKKLLNNYYESNNKVIYGGGINEENITILKKIEALDGFLIGGASLDIEKTNSILNTLKQDS